MEMVKIPYSYVHNNVDEFTEYMNTIVGKRPVEWDMFHFRGMDENYIGSAPTTFIFWIKNPKLIPFVVLSLKNRFEKN